RRARSAADRRRRRWLLPLARHLHRARGRGSLLDQYPGAVRPWLVRTLSSLGYKSLPRIPHRAVLTRQAACVSIAAERAELAVGGLDAGLLAPTHRPRISLPGRMHGSAAGPLHLCDNPRSAQWSAGPARSKRPFDGGEDRLVWFCSLSLASRLCSATSRRQPVSR